MVYRIVITHKAKKDIDGLEQMIRERLGKKLLHITEPTNFQAAARQLIDSRIGTYRLRVGDYRVLCDLDEEEVIVILRVQHRKDVYKK